MATPPHRVEWYLHRPLPRPTLDSAPFWASCRAHAMRLQRCSACGRFWFVPGPICPYCGSLEYHWEKVSGDAEVFSFSWAYYAAPGFEDRVPYAYAVVELAEGPMMATNVIGCTPPTLRIGQRAHVHYEDVSAEITLPLFLVEADDE